MNNDPKKNHSGRDPQNDPDQSKRTKSILTMVVVALVFTVIINLIYTSISNSYLKQITYTEFTDMLEAGQVQAVDIDTDRFLILTKEEAEKPSAKQIIYYTGRASGWDYSALDAELDAQGVEKDVPIVEEMSPLLSILLTWILPLAIFYLVISLFMNSMSKRMGGGGGIGGIGQSKAKVYMEKETGVTFADVAGQDEAKESLVEIIDFLHNPQKYAAIGAKLPKGALLVGSPGTGKTLLAKAVAGEAKVPFFSISGSEFVEMFVGMGAAKVRDLFKQANEKAPCIVFIDEIDAIGKKRDTGGYGGNDEREQTLNQLLAEMDGFDSSKGVVLLAATNRPETLDPALLRPGRFDRRVPVELPDLQGRIAILKVHGRDVHIDGDVDWGAIARATAGASGAELANIINEGALRAVRQGRKTVTQADLEESVETVIAGAQRKNAVISPEEKKIVAYHEVGHALVAALQSHSAPVTKITIVPRTSGALGYTMQVEEQDTLLMSKEEALDKIATYTGGRVAEELIFGSITSGASNDIEQATKLARAMVTRLGMSDNFGMVAMETVSNQYLGGDTSLACSEQTAAKIDEEVRQIIEQCHDRAKKILSDNLPKLHELAQYLLEKETITGEEFMEILNRPLAAEPKAIEEK